MSNHLFKMLREPLREYIPDDSRYENTFDWFEYLFSLVHVDVGTTLASLRESLEKNSDFYWMAPMGRFGWRNRYGNNDIIAETELKEGNEWPDKVAAVIAAGFFESGGNKVDKYQAVKKALDQFVAKVRAQWY